jgi:hypothetical protein
MDVNCCRASGVRRYRPAGFAAGGGQPAQSRRACRLGSTVAGDRARKGKRGGGGVKVAVARGDGPASCPAGRPRASHVGWSCGRSAGPNGKVDARGDRRPALTSLLGNDSSRAETERRQFGTAGWDGASAGDPAQEAVSLADAVPAADRRWGADCLIRGRYDDHGRHAPLFRARAAGPLRIALVTAKSLRAPYMRTCRECRRRGRHTLPRGAPDARWRIGYCDVWALRPVAAGSGREQQPCRGCRIGDKAALCSMLDRHRRRSRLGLCQSQGRVEVVRRPG